MVPSTESLIQKETKHSLTLFRSILGIPIDKGAHSGDLGSINIAVQHGRDILPGELVHLTEA